MTGDLLAFLLASTIIVAFPGPDTLVVVRGLLTGGRSRAIATALGVLSGLLIWLSATALGLSAILRASERAYLVLRIVGAIYLVTLGVRALYDRHRSRHAAAGSDVVPSAPRASLLGTGYRAGLLTDLLNPKVGVFFVTFLPGFVPHGKSVGLWTFVLGIFFVAETLAYFVLLVAASERVATLMTSVRARRRIDGITGVVLIGLGLRLALEG